MEQRPTTSTEFNEFEFELTFKPVYDKETGSAFVTWEEADKSYINHVWTIVEGDDGDLYAVPGIHYVNRIDYITTEVPWETGFEEGVWARFEDEEDQV